MTFAPFPGFLAVATMGVLTPGLGRVAGRARALFERDRFHAWMERTTAAVLIGLGLKLAFEQR